MQHLKYELLYIAIKSSYQKNSISLVSQMGETFTLERLKKDETKRNGVQRRYRAERLRGLAVRWWESAESHQNCISSS